MGYATHPTEDELIQHLCGENGAADRERLQDHLADCDDCRLACEEITAALTMVNETVPEPPDGFERIMWAKVQQQIAVMPTPSRWTWRALVPAGAMAAVAVAGIAFLNRPVAPPTTDAPPPVETEARSEGRLDRSARDRVLYAALESHFEQTEMLLVELRNARATDSLAFERVSADDLVFAGRLYRQTATQGGHVRLAQVLDELEPVLVEVANSPTRMSSRDRQWVRSRIEEDALLFKVRAANNDIRERVANADQ